MKLSVLDQSFTRAADKATEALHETISMAQWCERLGFERFWVSEHHAFSTLAGSAPEILIAALGAATNSIRLGSGGIMLPHYSAYKVAEVFSLLANLYPNRIDLGIGRAPGADMSTAVALATDNRPKFERFPQLVEELTTFLRDDSAKPLVSPKPPRDLPIWMLGSSPDSAELAAQRGLPYNLALFINPQAQQQLIKLYKRYFQSQGEGNKPYAIITMAVFCCATEEEALVQQHAFDVNFFRFVTGQRGDNGAGGLLSPEQAQDFASSPQFEAFVAQRNLNRAVGDPQQVAETVHRVARNFSADEVMMVSNLYDFEARKQSFRLTIEACA